MCMELFESIFGPILPEIPWLGSVDSGENSMDKYNGQHSMNKFNGQVMS